MNQKLAIPLLSLILSVGFTGYAAAETVLEQIERTGVLRAGVRTDAVPFSYLNDNGEIEGYSVDLIRLIHGHLEEKLNQPIRLEMTTVTLLDRFEQVQKGNLDLVCEATSITAERENGVDFSTPFFVTGIQMLVKTENRDRLDPTQLSETDISTVSLERVTIGFLESTTADSELRPVYPEAQWEAVPSRAEGIRRLQAGELQGIVSDGILLLGQLWKDGSDRQNFQLVPSQPLTFENYGCILPMNSREWSRVVNSTIASPENTTLWNQWFDTNQGRFPYRKFE
ncbi:amino acid ABC transporter substrate-binding protein [Arthrospira sp. O9.13F]|nr:amino acid ABC transporter substrate-binding protein [Arthrospira sp. O9.13F]